MSSKVMEISRLPYNIAGQLRRVGDFYICSRFTEDVIGPRIVKIGESIYYRFMKFIYLPWPPEKLNPEQIIEVCNLRLDHLDELVDFKLNRCIVAAIADCVTSNVVYTVSPLKALDFGCGSGLSSQLLLEHIPNLEVVGVDISKKAVLQCHKQGLATALTFPGESLPFEAASFDLIFAIFVMHFNIDIPTLIQLRRVLRTTGKFVFNLYKRDIDEINRQLYKRDIDGIIRQLEEAGFCSIEVRSNLPKVSPNHLIVSCGVLPPYKTVFH